MGAVGGRVGVGVGLEVWPFVALSWLVVGVHVGWERGAVGGSEGSGTLESTSRGVLDVSVIFSLFYY